MTRLEEYHKELKDRVAGACMDRAPDGTCTPPKGRRCALDLNLREIVKAVKAIKSDDMGDYASEIRATVCEQCVNQDDHGECDVRDSLDCCLNNFMMLIVDAIEDVDARHPAETLPPAPA